MLYKDNFISRFFCALNNNNINIKTKNSGCACPLERISAS